jgi:hypothetical protein
VGERLSPTKQASIVLANAQAFTRAKATAVSLGEVPCSHENRWGCCDDGDGSTVSGVPRHLRNAEGLFERAVEEDKCGEIRGR